jgi:hypothetical protein
VPVESAFSWPESVRSGFLSPRQFFQVLRFRIGPHRPLSIFLRTHSGPDQQRGPALDFRPYTLGSENPDRLSDHSTSPDGEQGYWRGFHQGMTYVLNGLAGGISLAELRAFAKRVDEWRRQPVQLRGAPPGCPRPAGLLSKWDRE